MIKTAIIGASGYTGVELIKLLLQHPKVELSKLIAESNAGKSMQDIYSHHAFAELPALQSFEELSENDINNIDVFFLCLPHATTHMIANKLSDIFVKLNCEQEKVIIDLSADFRLRDSSVYKSWYDVEHTALELQKKSVYGLSEHYREDIQKSNIIACPGCYPTSILLPLLPLVKEGLIDVESIFCDSKSGISGAGRKATIGNLFCEINDNLKPYGLGGHRHLAEIEQEVTRFSANTNKNPQAQHINISFIPQVIAVNRGILSNIYIKSEASFEQLKGCLQSYYNDSNFVKIAEGQTAITLRDVQNTNNCYINIYPTRIKGNFLILSAIDNLIKGASGQAIQNMNIRFGLAEDLGLPKLASFP